MKQVEFIRKWNPTKQLVGSIDHPKLREEIKSFRFGTGICSWSQQGQCCDSSKCNCLKWETSLPHYSFPWSEWHRKEQKQLLNYWQWMFFKKHIKPPIPDGHIQWNYFGKWLSCQKNCAISSKIVTASEDWCTTNTKYVVWNL